MSPATPAGGLTRRDTLPAWFWEIAKARGDGVAMRRKHLGIWESVSWRSYAENARAVGTALLAAGCARGERVAVLSGNRPEWCYVDFGALGVGAAAVGIHPAASARQAERMLRECAARVLFVEGEEQLAVALTLAERLPALAKLVYFDARGLHGFSDPRAKNIEVQSFEDFCAAGRLFDELHAGRWEQEVAAARPEDIALIAYTSGSTGEPRGVMLSHRNLIFQVGAMERLCPGLEGDSRLSFLPLSHVVERCFSTYLPLQHGTVVHFGEGVPALLENLREVAPQAVMAVPRVWEKLYSAVTVAIAESTPLAQWGYRAALNTGYRVADLRLARRPVPARLRLAHGLARLFVLRRVRTMTGLARARMLLSGAAPIAPDLARWYRALDLSLQEVYGQTECAGLATGCAPGEHKSGTAGMPLPGTELRISPEGEIQLRGPHVFVGYVGEAASPQSDAWLDTGDAGTLDADGHVIPTGRLVERIRTSAGRQVTPAELESRLKFSPYISDAVVVGHGRPHLSCLVMIDHESMVKYARDKDIPFTNFASLARAEPVRRLIEAEIEAVNRQLGGEGIRRFALLDVELAAGDEEITPTLGLRRQAVAERFRALVEAMYTEPA
jgi:long-chain acyl-CoA synthetase